MFALFPDLLDLYPYAGTLLRFFVGYLFIRHGWLIARHLSTPDWSRARRVSARALGYVELSVGVLLLVGVFVQGAALVGAAIAFFEFESAFTKTEEHTHELHLLICTSCLALVLLGAGPFAIDLPL